MHSHFLSLLLLPVHALALQVPHPRATRAADDFDPNGISPRPTAPPTVPRAHFELKRQVSSDGFLGWIATDNTCGYVGGRAGAVKTCELGQVCGAVPGPNVNIVACLPTNTLSQATGFGACIGSADLSASCDGNCRQDLYTVKCGSSEYPFCYPYTIADLNAIFFSCDSVSVTTFQPFLTTYVGQTEDRSWLELYDSSSSLALTESDFVLTVPETTITRTASASAAETSSGGGGGGGGDGGSSVPAGAIAGGVVGGLAVLALAAWGIIFLLRRKKTHQPQPPAEAHAPPVFTGGHDPKGPTQSMAYVQPPYPQAYYPYQPVQSPPGPGSDGLQPVGYYPPPGAPTKDNLSMTPSSPVSALPRYSVAGETQASSGPTSPHPGSPPGLEAVQQIQQVPQPQAPPHSPQPPSELWAGGAPRQA